MKSYLVTFSNDDDIVKEATTDSRDEAYRVFWQNIEGADEVCIRKHVRGFSNTYQEIAFRTYHYDVVKSNQAEQEYE